MCVIILLWLCGRMSWLMADVRKRTLYLHWGAGIKKSFKLWVCFQVIICFLKIERKHLLEIMTAYVPPSFLPATSVVTLSGGNSSCENCVLFKFQGLLPWGICLNLKVWTLLHFLNLTYARQNVPRNMANRLKTLPLPHSGRKPDLWVHGTDWIQIHSVQQKSTTSHYGPGFALDNNTNETSFQLLGLQNPRSDIGGTYMC